MKSRFNVLMVCLGAVLALSAVATGVAQAAKPAQPVFTSSKPNNVIGEALTTNLTIEDSSAQSRLLDPSLVTAIRCENDSSIGTIGPKGLDNGRVTYTGCKTYKLEENVTTKQWEEGETVGTCKIAGEKIETEQISSRLVWNRATSQILVLYQPLTAANFVVIKFETGHGCGLSSLEVKGAILGLPTNSNAEGLLGFQTFETVNGGTAKVAQRFTEWEVTPPGEANKNGTAEFKVGTNNAGLESDEQIELVKETSASKRGLWGIHE
jgi:hypothetical protein